MRMIPYIATYRSGIRTYRADTCEPLREAAAQGEVQLRARVHGAYPGSPLPDRMLPEVRTVGYWDAAYNQSWGLDWHRNEGIELTYVSHGKVGFSVDNEHYLLKRGDLTITRPWQIHCVGSPTVSASRLQWLILDVGVRHPNQQWHWPRWLASSESDIASLTEILSHNEQPVWEANDEVRYYFEKLGETLDAEETCPNESYLKLYISGLIVSLTTLLKHHSPSLDKSLTSTQRTVEVFLSSLRYELEREWSLELMAEACGLGRSQFARYCKQITNMSPGEYLTLHAVSRQHLGCW